MCTFRGPLLLQKVHATEILSVKVEAKRNNPEMHVSYVHGMIQQLETCLVKIQDQVGERHHPRASLSERERERERLCKKRESLIDFSML